MEYLALPFVLREGYLEKANLQESITYSIGLILSARTGSMPFNPEYGCEIWEKEFSDLYTTNKAEIRSSLRNAIDKIEKRLYNMTVSFMNVGEDQGGQHALGVAVKVTGNYREDSEEKKYEGTFYLG